MEDKVREYITDKLVNVKELTLSELKAINQLYMAILEFEKTK